MKHILSILLVTFGLLNCKAQSPIISLEDWDGDEQKNAYYKDISNELKNYEGTWLYTNGNTSLKIILVKSVMFYNGEYYEDLLIGGYKYVESGTEKINTLSDADNPKNGLSASIHGNTIYEDCKFLPVDDCSNSEKRLGIGILDKNDKHWGRLMLHKRTVNGKEALKINIEMNYAGEDPKDGVLPPPSIPWSMRNIILFKQ